MRLRNIPGAQDTINKSAYVIQNPKEAKGRWKEIFGNDNPIQIEIGMGKGKFILGMSELHQDINYIGIEMYSSVLLRALQKVGDCKVPNLRFLCMDAKEITEAFGEGEIDQIFLNFSDPWPKDRHAKRRLPSREFLARYEQILKSDGKIEFKTDNRLLFDFAMEELEPAGWIAESYSFDLHSDSKMMMGNVMTEYEEKFSAIGNPICKYIIYKKK